MPKTVRITTYNINWGKGSWKLTAPLASMEALKATHADVILLQETTPFWQEILEKNFMKRYPHRYFRHHDNAGGLAILSKFPCETLEYGHPQIGWHPLWIFKAETILGPVQFVNLHLTPPLKNETSMGLFFHALFTSAPIRLREIYYLKSKLNSDYPTIIAGDFNEGDRGHAVKDLRASNYIDALKATQFRGYTWRWRIAVLSIKERLDRIFSSPSLTPIQSQVIYGGDSDHFPLSVDFINNNEKSERNFF
ncbi:endonuclease/exonuclease/phosphatase family protein [Legionella jordanis]|uniref:Endonuclease/Exonuclease/phosphatase family protein n=1 Tax=Legionella jordanis TaxID=456 RepID=A0A0W0VD80_9GAMM|nr:endonuclease/exonuclease/phosphatase family protein [Legionella jordanis]KTD18071.1 Endonuclease/Exonuclease/phosphatase family protein [Legionella jordanis]RMX02243.1 endonuclease/exonuclease/phosphatase family protein [Legionella jordanis]RMX21271.1 endonuclease/exonuclease/phosphatase family protein [Legionella jordanis]VEH13837.1 Uncharacterized protein conserved in bacteria [Legionella jordanis]